MMMMIYLKLPRRGDMEDSYKNTGKDLKKIDIGKRGSP
jgi:hypothetical protein